MRVLLFGASGQLGKHVVNSLCSYSLISPSRHDLDIRYFYNVKNFFKITKPDVVINLAAFTNVELAENNRKDAYIINSLFPKVIAELCKNTNIPLIHISTDYVFDGNKKTKYYDDDIPNPLNYYGNTKFLGEKYIQEINDFYIILRTSWLYSFYGNNFLVKVLDKIKKKEQIYVVNDQFGSPTSAKFVSNVILQILGKLDKGKTGIYHSVSSGSCSWYEFSKKIADLTSEIDSINLIKPIKTENYPSIVKRPKSVVLDNTKLINTFMIESVHWADDLENLVKS